MNSAILSRPACNALRGLAIIGIFLHNYCHWLGPIVKENEYQYFQHNVDWLNQVMVSMDLNLPVHLLSFFGHYGVPVFLFLSAYGLVMKYGLNLISLPNSRPECTASRARNLQEASTGANRSTLSAITI